MKSIIDWIEKFIQGNNKNIFKYYEKCDSYFIDLINSKGLLINSLINFDSIEEVKNIIYSMIDIMNSGLITIGFSSRDLEIPSEIYDKTLKTTLKNYNNYLELFNLNLKNYTNTYLFIALLEFIADIDSNKLENLDLFDLIPKGFLKHLQTFKKKNSILKENLNVIKEFIRNINDYFDISSLEFKTKDFIIKPDQDILDESNILQKLKVAKEESLGVLHIDKNSLLENESLSSIKPPEKGAIEQQEEFNLLKYFQYFIALPNDTMANFNIHKQNFDDIVIKNYNLYDLENLFYIVSIYKMIRRKLPINKELIESVVGNYVNGKIFSTGKYHIPNPISIFYGLALFSQLELINSTTIIDLLDIEMNLENELSNFNPKNTYLNFYTLMSLKLLETSGGVIKNKEYLLEALKNFKIEMIEDFKPYKDLFFFIASMKVINPKVDVRDLKQNYYKLLRGCILTNGSVNNNLTDTARTILTFHMLGLNKQNDEMIQLQYDFLLKNLTFFNNKLNNKFDWKTNRLALKVELRMLFWTLLSFA